MNFPPLLNCPPLLSHLQGVSVTPHTYAHIRKGIFFLISLRHHPTSILPGRKKMVQERWTILLRDVMMLLSINTYFFHLHSPEHFTVLLSIYYCTSSRLLEPCEIDKREIISSILQQLWYFQSKWQNEN